MNKILLTLVTLSILSLSVHADTLTASSLLSSQGFTINGPSGSQVGYRASPAGDFNNDGYDDLFFSSTSSNLAFLVLGGSSATSSSSFTLSSTMSSDQGFRIVGPSSSTFGSAFAAGDFNDDGYSDLMIGASGSNTVYVLFGCATADIPTRFGTSFTVSSSMATTTGFQINGPSNSQFGISLASADFNYDGKKDIAIGANNAAQVYLIFGCSSGVHPGRYGASFTVSSTMQWTQGIVFNAASGSNFGLSVAMGDLNDDNQAELIVGGFTTSVYVLIGQSISSLSAGTAFGSTGSFTVSTSMTSAQGFEVHPGGSMFFGSTVAYLGDFNGDERGDFAIGTPYENKAWISFGIANLNLRYGSTFTVGSSMSSSVGFELSGPSGFGDPVSRAGDINGDGYADLLVGATDSAYVFYGCSSTTLPTRFGSTFAASSSITTAQGFIVSGLANSDFLGYFSVAGDINNDSYDDLVFGAAAANKAYVITGYCTAGNYFLASSCVACPTGSYCAGGRSKTTCPTGSTSAASSTAATDCSCNAGSYSTSAGGTCNTCTANSYCTGGTSITSCDSGKTSPAGSSASSACVTSSAGTGNGATCAAGTYSTTSGGSCNTCPANSYCTGGTNLSACPSGTTSSSGSTSANACTTTSSSSGAESIGFTVKSALMTSAALFVGVALL